jgi:hypothetical protein
MAAIETDRAGHAVLPNGEGQPTIGPSETSTPSLGTGGCSPSDWEVWLCLGQHLITRKAHPRGPLKNRNMEREEVIWPAWPATTAEEASVAAMPLVPVVDTERPADSCPVEDGDQSRSFSVQQLPCRHSAACASGAFLLLEDELP